MQIKQIAGRRRWCVPAFILISLIAGCSKDRPLESAGRLASRADTYYEKAVKAYSECISRGIRKKESQLELGRLFYSRGEFQKAIGILSGLEDAEAVKIAAISLYRSGNYTDALDMFSRLSERADQEAMYYYGLTCEKLSLFDKALQLYGKIKGEWQEKAVARAKEIEKNGETTQNIKEVSAEIEKVLSAAPDVSRYSEAGALYLLCEESVQVFADKTQASQMHYLIRIINERGKEQFSEAKIDYDSTYEKVQLEYARTIKPDGTVINIGSRHIRDVSKYLNFPLYSNARVCIISFPEVTEGAVVEYKVKVLSNKLVNGTDFVSAYPVQNTEPIVKADFRITVPSGTRLNIKKLNEDYNSFSAQLDPEIKPEGQNTSYYWSFKDIPQIIPEAHMPEASEIVPTILVSSFSDWKQIHQWWWPLTRDKIKADPAIKEKTAELTKGLQTKEAKAQAIYNFCAQNIRYVAVEYGDAGYEPHSAADIFRNKYGDCKDQSVLLVTMLREAGINAWPVLIATREYYNASADFPSILFNHCIAALSLQESNPPRADELIFLDPTAETCPFKDLPHGDQGRNVLLMTDEGQIFCSIPVFGPEHNSILQETVLTVNPDESIEGDKMILSHGIYDQMQRYWFLFTPPNLIEHTIKERIQGVSIGAKLKAYKVENASSLDKQVKLTYSFLGPELFVAAGDLRILPMLAEVESSAVAKEERVYPLDIGPLETKQTDWKIKLPPGYRIKFLPQAVESDTKWLYFRASYSEEKDGIDFSQRTVIKTEKVSCQDYNAFKNHIRDLAKKTKQRIVLEKEKK